MSDEWEWGRWWHLRCRRRAPEGEACDLVRGHESDEHVADRGMHLVVWRDGDTKAMLPGPDVPPSMVRKWMEELGR